ncbi:MAG: ferric iron uptake transcriptional regulator [Pseudomonadota bacterium]
MQKNTSTRAAELKTSGLRATLPRLKVMEIFERAQQRHLSAEDVYKVLLNEHADIGLATVYRVLMQFVHAGLLSRNVFDSGKAVFEINEGSHHDHMVCLRCGAVAEFYDAEIERRQHAVALERGFELREHTLALYGVCSAPACKERK